MKMQLTILLQVFLIWTAVSPDFFAQQPVLEKQFDDILSEQFKEGEPGAAVLVARNGEIIYKKAFGITNMELNVPMQPEHVFRIGSITKQFTAVAILQLMEQGRLTLQDEITRFIPDYPVHGNKITIEHLLTHTSGIRNYSDIRDTLQRGKLDFSPAEMINLFRNEPLRFAPGTKWEYSNSGYFLLGYIIEKITGKTFGEYMEENIFKPLGLTNTYYSNNARIIKNRADGYTANERGFENAPYLSPTQPYSAGSIESTVEDLLKWNRAVHSLKLLSRETLAKALTRFKLADGRETNYGYGWRSGYIQGSPSLWHGGLINGFISMAMYLPEEEVFVAVFSNCDCNSPEDITAKLAALAIGKPYESKAIIVEKDILQEYTGVYENSNGRLLIISLNDSILFAQSGRGPGSIMSACQKNKFFFKDDIFFTMEFIRDNKGAIDKVLVRNRTSNEAWYKTNKPAPVETEITLSENILERYTGQYEITPEFTFEITRDKNQLYVQATGQEKFEIFAEAENKFFTKVNDAQLEFVSDTSGRVVKAILTQGGRQTEANKINR